ncbi:hypothetical protein ACFV84_35115 [Kitasatospora sp. NPDC059811]|nr:hypothetical protein [Streptomyces sp. MJM8645]
MTFNADDEVLIVSCEDDPRAAGRTGRIAPVLCHAHELTRTGR